MISIRFSNLSFARGIIFPESGNIIITIEGHSGKGTKGNDIVCAGVSSLSQTLILSVSRILKIEQEIRKNSTGYLSTEIDIAKPGKEDLEKLKILIESFLLGVSEINREHPGTIIIDIERH